MSGFNDTLGDLVTSHDSSKDVDKDSGDARIIQKKLEGVSDLSGCSGTSNVQKVGRGSTVMLDEVHGCHGETSAIDETADVAFETDVV
jgi:hypothetical protein